MVITRKKNIVNTSVNISTMIKKYDVIKQEMIEMLGKNILS